MHHRTRHRDGWFVIHCIKEAGNIATCAGTVRWFSFVVLPQTWKETLALSLEAAGMWPGGCRCICHCLAALNQGHSHQRKQQVAHLQPHLLCWERHAVRKTEGGSLLHDIGPRTYIGPMPWDFIRKCASLYSWFSLQDREKMQGVDAQKRIWFNFTITTMVPGAAQEWWVLFPELSPFWSEQRKTHMAHGTGRGGYFRISWNQHVLLSRLCTIQPVQSIQAKSGPLRALDDSVGGHSFL